MSELDDRYRKARQHKAIPDERTCEAMEAGRRWKRLITRPVYEGKSMAADRTWAPRAEIPRDRQS